MSNIQKGTIKAIDRRVILIILPCPIDIIIIIISIDRRVILIILSHDKVPYMILMCFQDSKKTEERKTFESGY